MKLGQVISANQASDVDEFHYVTLPDDVSALRVRTRGASGDLTLRSRDRLPVPTVSDFQSQSDKPSPGD